jgi:hypothetical protein
MASISLKLQVLAVFRKAYSNILIPEEFTVCRISNHHKFSPLRTAYFKITGHSYGIKIKDFSLLQTVYPDGIIWYCLMKDNKEDLLI